MKTTTLAVLSLLSANPALSHTAATSHAHADASVWPVLSACVGIAIAAIVYARAAAFAAATSAPGAKEPARRQTVRRTEVGDERRAIAATRIEGAFRHRVPSAEFGKRPL